MGGLGPEDIVHDPVYFTNAAVPEPSSFALFSAGLAAVLGYAWRRWRVATMAGD
jgi:hypothetical protein